MKNLLLLFILLQIGITPSLCNISSTEEAYQCIAGALWDSKDEHKNMVTMLEGLMDRMTNLESGLESNQRDLQSLLASQSSSMDRMSNLESDLKSNQRDLQSLLASQSSSIIDVLDKSKSDQLRDCLSKNYDTAFEDSCYFVGSSKETWSKAQEICSGKGGNLVKITSQKEFSFLQSLITDDAWIGLSDQTHEGQFKWIDGSNLATDISKDWWCKGEPNNFKSFEDCAHFKNNECSKLLNDRDCNASYKYICEMPALLI